MKIIVYTYEYTEQLRISDGMDRIPAGTKISTGTFTVAIPDDSHWSLDAAYSLLVSRHWRDPAFDVSGQRVAELNAIVYSPVYRI